ncbi:MAG TPA: glycosyltransferase family 4 protein [Acidimicrobiales bacterium]|nr:glycosyltransferase family 4 protein [Acidimicrobiales bacterium]
MRVGLVCPYSLSLPGGVQGQVLGLARALRTAGHEARVLGPCDGPPPEVGVVPLGNTIAALANGSVAPLAPDLPCVLRTIRAIRDEEFDVLHLHEPLAPGPTLTSVVLSLTPTVATFHAAGGSAAYRWLRPLTRWLGRRLTLRCAVSEDARDMAAQALGGEYVLVHNGIDIERYAKATPSPTDGPTVVFLSRHESRKGLGVLLAALEHLPSDVRLWVASDGPETATLRARWGDNPRVQWLGRLTEEEKAERLRGADVLCAPSLHGESFGMVLLEGMAASTPIVASDLPGYRNVARHGVEALLVPPGDPVALAKAITRVLEEPATAATLVAGGEARAAEFSMDGLAARYLDLYEQATSTGT